MATINLGELSSITEKHFYPRLVDNIFNSNILLARARKKWKEKWDGGTSLVVPVAYATTSSSGSYNGGSETLSTSSNDQIDAATFAWAYYYAAITIARKDELANSGKAQIVNFVKAKVQLAEKSLANTMGTDMISGTAAPALIGLATAVGTSRTYGGISSTTYTWWNSSVDSTTTALSIPVIQGLYGDATVGNDKPTIIVSTQDVFDNYVALLQPQQRFTDSATADAGFTNLLYQGTPWVVDSHIGSGDVYFLNEDYLHLFVHPEEDFRFDPFIKTTNSNQAVARIFWAGQLACSNPRMQSKATAIA